jgi:thiamine biosynthesis lipoprotein
VGAVHLALIAGVVAASPGAGPDPGVSDPELVRETRLAMGTVVGLTIRTPDAAAAHRAAAAAWAAIEQGEAELSEWRPDSATARLVSTGGPVRFSPGGEALFTLAEAIRVASGGAFALPWTGGTLTATPDGWTLAGGPVGLGGILKGYLSDRAADALRAAGEANFVVDAAGDVVAAGSGGDGPGWSVVVEADGAPFAAVRLRDEALSTSGEDQQPGHIRDPRTGAAVTCSRVATVVAPSGAVADGLATALYASCGQRGLAEGFGATALYVGADGRRRWSRGARRRFALAR